MRTLSARAAFVTAIATVVVGALFSANAAASAGGPTPFRRDLHRIDAHLRVGIEYAPAELGEGLRSSETVCELAEKMEERGDAERAEADWSALSQLVDEVDRRASERIDGALERARNGLLGLRERYSSGWSDRRKVARLGLGVTRALAGIARLQAAMAEIEGSFDAWSARRCRGANEAIEAGVARVPAALAQINAGMRVLLELAFPTVK